jgi:CRP/FNR family transcriptional regulator, cyclic AMP receptor protein
MLLKALAIKYGKKVFHKKNNSLNIHLEKGLFYILNGTVKYLYGHTKDQVIAINIYKGGEFFGYVDSVCFTDKCNMELFFLEDTELIFLDNETIQLHSTLDNNLRVDFIKTIRALLQDSIEKFFVLSILKKNEVIVQMLYYLTIKFGKVLNNGKVLVTVKLNDNDLKELCNTSREKVNRTLSVLKKDGILERKNGFLVISSKEELSSLIPYDFFAKY